MTAEIAVAGVHARERETSPGTVHVGPVCGERSGWQIPLQVRGATNCTWPIWPDTDVSVKGVGYTSRSHNTSVWLKSDMKWFGTYVYFSFFSHSSATCIVIQ